MTKRTLIPHTVITLVFTIICLYSCKDSNRSTIEKVVREWHGKEIILPKDMVFTQYGRDTIDYRLPISSHKIIMYVDSTGCMACKLQLHKWRQFISEVDSISNRKVPIIFVFQPNKKVAKLSSLLERSEINIPIYLDNSDELGRANQFPSVQEYQTFLVDQDNKVAIIGSPILNSKIKEMYLSEISKGAGNAKRTIELKDKTDIQADCTHFELGTIPKGESRNIDVPIKNIGTSHLVIIDYQASCGCMLVEYDKEPTPPGGIAHFRVTYEADDVGPFNKTITVHTNANDSPLILHLIGKVQ